VICVRRRRRRRGRGLIGSQSVDVGADRMIRIQYLLIVPKEKNANFTTFVRTLSM